MSMNVNFARVAFLIVCLAAVIAAAFRIATASDRVRDRRDTARDVCVRSGGSWVKVDDMEICRREGAALPI